MRVSSPEQQRETFDAVLDGLMSGELPSCPTDTGLDDATVEALDAIPGATDQQAAVEHARAVFETSDPVFDWARARLELRYNMNHDELGRFAESDGESVYRGISVSSNEMPRELAGKIESAMTGGDEPHLANDLIKYLKSEKFWRTPTSGPSLGESWAVTSAHAEGYAKSASKFYRHDLEILIKAVPHKGAINSSDQGSWKLDPLEKRFGPGTKFRVTGIKIRKPGEQWKVLYPVVRPQRVEHRYNMNHDELGRFSESDTHHGEHEKSDIPFSKEAVDRYPPGTEIMEGQASITGKTPTSLTDEDIDTMADTLCARYAACDQATRDAGAAWYPDARDLLNDVAQENGYTEAQAMAIAASLSPRTRWLPNNVVQAIQFMSKYGSGPNANPSLELKGGLGKNWDRALYVSRLADPREYLTGTGWPNDFKIANFYDNFSGDTNAVTVDTWAAKAAVNADEKTSTKLISGAGYEKVAEAYRRGAARAGVDPSVFQATVWIHISGNGIKKTENRMSVAGFYIDPVFGWARGYLEQRFNPNHDELGRFSESDSSGDGDTASGEKSDLVIHRGLAISNLARLPEGLEDRLNQAIDAGQPDSQAAQALMDYVGSHKRQRGQQGLGVSWTSNPDVVDDFAESSMHPKFHVAMSGRAHSQGIDRQATAEQNSFSPHEYEVRLFPGARVSIQSLRVKRPGGQWVELLTSPIVKKA